VARSSPTRTVNLKSVDSAIFSLGFSVSFPGIKKARSIADGDHCGLSGAWYTQVGKVPCLICQVSGSPTDKEPRLFPQNFLELFNPADAALAEIDLDVAGELSLDEIFHQFQYFFQSLH
jgi:hypothetical protein